VARANCGRDKLALLQLPVLVKYRIALVGVPVPSDSRILSNRAAFGGLFLGGIFPSKIGVSAPLDREGMPVQKYVASYLTKFNPIWFK